MRSEQLEYMLDLQDTGSISKTAEKHLITHQAVSKAIKALENELSVILLVRSSKGVSFTSAGKYFCDFARTVVNEKNKLKEIIAPYILNTKPLITGHLVIYAVPRYITPSFFNFIKKMHIMYPKLRLTVHNVTPDRIIDKIRFDENTLFLFTAGYNIYEQAEHLPSTILDFIEQNNLSCDILSRESLFACVHNKSPLSQQEIMTVQDIKHSPYVSFTYPFDDAAQSQFIIDGFEQQKNIIKSGKVFGRYTQREYDSFFQINLNY